jgi:hypothetical protein
VLRGSGLVTAIQDRDHGGRFRGTAYMLTVDPNVLSRGSSESFVSSSPTRVPQPRIASKSAVTRSHQLVLLPSV